jgi:hypothetical protein
MLALYYSIVVYIYVNKAPSLIVQIIRLGMVLLPISTTAKERKKERLGDDRMVQRTLVEQIIFFYYHIIQWSLFPYEIISQ